MCPFFIYHGVIWGLIFSLEGAFSLRCWHCISDDCDTDPIENYKASERACQPGQACQKVYFEMYSDTDHKCYQSTVRGCSTSCEPRDDFINCTHELKTSRGCIRKDCCHDNDLCNHGNSILTSATNLVFLCLSLTTVSKLLT